MSPSIAYWPGVLGGTAEYRCFGPGRALERLGWDVTFLPTGPIEEGTAMPGYTHDGHVEGDPDVLVLSRARGPDIGEMVRTIAKGGHTTIVYDCDDWMYGLPDYNPASRHEYIETMFEAMAAANLVTVSTPELAEGYSHLNRCVVLPNYLDPEIWDWDDNQKFRQRREHIHIGWMGAFHWRSGDLELLKPWVHNFLDDHPEVRFVALGAKEVFEFLGIEGLSYPAHPDAPNEMARYIWPYQHLPAMLAHLDVSLVPLTYNKFNQAKSWCKGAESNAMGVPIVATPSREYRRYIEPGVNGLFVRNNAWHKPLESIMYDLARYREGARKVAERYYIDDHIGAWADAYTSAA